MSMLNNEFASKLNANKDVLTNVFAVVGQGFKSMFSLKKIILVLACLVFAFLVTVTPRAKIVNDVEWHRYYCADASRNCEVDKTWDDFSEEYGVTFHYNNPILKFIGTYAFTFGNDVYFADDQVPMRLRKHEYRHVQQFRRDGAFVFVVKYFTEYFTGLASGMSDPESYANISYELEATAAEEYVRPDQELAR